MDFEIKKIEVLSLGFALLPYCLKFTAVSLIFFNYKMVSIKST